MTINYITLIKTMFLFLVFLCNSCQSKQQDKQSLNNEPKPTVLKQQSNKEPILKKYSVTLFQIDSLNANSGYGYDILIDDSRFIHQTNIPSVQGNETFANKKQAESVANLMVYKLEHNIMPPSVSKKELDSLHILK